jgi:acetamidase/formamidase
LHGDFDRDRAPALRVDRGDVVRVSLDAWWSAGPYRGGSLPVRPRVPEYAPAGSWGTTAAGGWPSAHNRTYGIENDPAVLTWELDADTMTGRNNRGHVVDLHPFLGVIGVAPAESGPHSTTPPRPTGGNLDCKELVAGSTLYLPIAVDGALLSVGDGHAAQGDGEVGGTAIECPMTVELGLDVRTDLPIATPHADTPSGWLTMGMAETLDSAAEAALNAMYDHMQRRYRLGRAETIALASVVVDVRVTQIVNDIVGVHALLPHGSVR